MGSGNEFTESKERPLELRPGVAWWWWWWGAWGRRERDSLRDKEGGKEKVFSMVNIRPGYLLTQIKQPQN